MRNTEQERESDYADVLVKSALVVEDFEESSAALLALKKRYKLRAGEVALQILHECIGDVFYRALAFEVLYAVSLDDAVAYIETCADKESAYVLGAMLTSVTEDVGVLECRGEILKAVSLLRRALLLRSSEDLSALSMQKTRFDDAYR
jgi:hypothetical protein